MTEQFIIDIGKNSAIVAMQVAAPALIATMAMGLLVSIFQAATQINEQTLSFIPKILAMVAASLFFGSWILEKIVTFSLNIFKTIPLITQ